VTKAATTTETGIRVYTCTVCKATKAETIEKVKETSTKKVGEVFKDVQATGWYHDAAQYMYDNRYMVGGGGVFGVSQSLTREQLPQVVLLRKILNRRTCHLQTAL